MFFTAVVTAPRALLPQRPGMGFAGGSAGVGQSDAIRRDTDRKQPTANSHDTATHTATQTEAHSYLQLAHHLRRFSSGGMTKWALIVMQSSHFGPAEDLLA